MFWFERQTFWGGLALSFSPLRRFVFQTEMLGKFV